MSSNREQFTTEIFVNNEQAQDATAKLTAKLEKQTQTYERLRAELGDFDKKTLKAKKSMEDTKASLDHAKTGVETYRKAIENLNDRSISQLVKMQKQLKRELDKTKPNTEEWKRLSKEYQQVTGRIESLKKAQQGVVKESDKSATAFGRFFKKVNDFYGGITVYAKAAKAGLQAIIGVTRQVINASQTMGDKWNNGMAAMKTTTEAFFMALSTGDWTAFNDGLLTALKNARELAELKDVLGDFNISGGVMQSEYLTGFNKARTTATDTEADPTARMEALKDMQSNLEAYNNFVQREGETTLKALMKSFDAWKGIVFDSEEEFHSFFIRLFEYTTTGYDEEVNELLRLESEVDKWTVIVGNAAQTGGKNIERLNANLLAAQVAYDAALAAASDETKALAKAVELPDDKKQELARLFQSWKQGVDTVEQRTIQMNRTRDRVMKQLGGNIDVMMTTIDEWVAKEKEGALARYEANATSMEATQAAFVVYQDEMARIEAEGEAKREAARAKAEEERRKAEEKARQERQAAAEKAYQNAQNKTAKAESAQLATLKGLYANGLMDKATYEAQKAVVEEDFLKQRLAVAQKYGKDTDQFMNQLLDRQIARMEKAKALLKEETDEMAKYYAHERGEDEQKTVRRESEEPTPEELKRQFQEKLWAKAADIRAAITEDSARTQYETEMKWIEKLHKDGLLSDEEFEKAKMDQKLGFAAKIAQEVNRYAEMASNFANALKESETAKMEAEYQKQLTAAGDNAEKREQIEAEYEEKKLDLQKKYADVEMAINIAKTIASGAVAAIRAYAEGGPYAGVVLAALIAATTAAEVATIVAQRNAIKATSVSSTSTASSGSTDNTMQTGTRTITGYSEGGNTKRAASDATVVGVVHANEWVAPAWMVRENPTVFADLEEYRVTLGRGRKKLGNGFADGGLASPQSGSMPTPSPLEEIDWQALRDFNAIMRYCATHGVFVKYGDIMIAKEKHDNFKKQTTR